MFVDNREPWPPPEPWRAPPPPRRLSRRGERVIGWIVLLNLLMLVFGPLAGATLFDAALAMLRG